MAKVTPAQISYTPEGKGLQTLRFHAVLFEAHEAHAEITKFPVQTGFQISNNSIRKNRVITISGLITNHLLRNAKNSDFQYSSNNSKTVFEAMEALVNSGEPCEVLTNLGVYNPVVFTKFSTKQEQGMVDSMKFTMRGEEVQVSDQVNGTAPKVVSFKSLEGSSKDVRVGQLEEAGFDICECNTVTEGQITLGQDFIIEGVNNVGQPVQTTYISLGQDPSTGSWNYEMHTSDTLMYTPPETPEVQSGDPSDLDLSSGFSDLSSCLMDAGEEVAIEAATDLIDTAMGELKKSLYGAFYETVNLTDNVYGQALISAGIGCFVRGFTKIEATFPYTPGEALPTTEQILESALEWGQDLFDETVTKSAGGVTTAPTTITQVQCCD